MKNEWCNENKGSVPADTDTALNENKGSVPVDIKQDFFTYFFLNSHYSPLTKPHKTYKLLPTLAIM